MVNAEDDGTISSLPPLDGGNPGQELRCDWIASLGSVNAASLHHSSRVKPDDGVEVSSLPGVTG